VLESWFRGEDPSWTPIVLDNVRLDLAVAHGAAYYGTVRRGRGVRIAAGLARSYYIGVESEPPAAVCMVPGNVEPGQEIDLAQHPFRTARPSTRRVSAVRLQRALADQPGDVLPVDTEQMKSLPPIRTVLRTRKKQAARSPSPARPADRDRHPGVVVQPSRNRPQLAAAVRCPFGDSDGHRSPPDGGRGRRRDRRGQLAGLHALIGDTFGTEGSNKPAGAGPAIGATLELDRWDWPMSLLRRIWETLLEFEAGRQKSPGHEQRWLNLLGFALRPGFGMAVDDWRVAQTWRAVQGRLIHGTAATRTESWILWRRIAGGLSAGQQQAIADPLLAVVRGLRRRLTKGGGDFGFTPQESIEMWRLLGALELLHVQQKIELGDLLIEVKDKRPVQPARPMP
jgi:hypothetical protein